jgi:hypothetical protein
VNRPRTAILDSAFFCAPSRRAALSDLSSPSGSMD